MIEYTAFAVCCAWLERNLDVVYFLYGLSFVVLGIAVLSQPRGKSRFRLGGIIGLLGLFGLTHGVNEWLDMWAIIKGPRPALDIAGWLLLTVSYIFLFEFGRRLFRPAGIRRPAPGKKMVAPPGGWLTPVLVALSLLAAAIAGDFPVTARIWIRYLLGFPGGVLIGLGFFSYYKRDEALLRPLGVRKYFLTAAAAFFAYGILGGLIGPRGNFFPASRINSETFLLLTRIPAPVFRSLCAVFSAGAVIGILKIFNWETTRRIEDALAVREKVTEGIDEGIFLVNRDYKITWANKKESAVHGEIVGEYCYRATHQRNTPCRGADHPCPIAEAGTTGVSERFVHTHYDRDNQPVYVEVSAYPIKDERGGILEFVHISRDITERVKLEEAIKSIAEPLLVVNTNGKITTVNRALLELGGYEENELLRQPVRLLFGEEEAWARIEILLDRGVLRDYELSVCVGAERENIPVLLNASRVEYQGRILATVCLLRDLREIKKLQDQLIHSQTMQATGNLAGGIAHDFNNILNVIKLTVQLLLKKSLPGEIEGDLREIQNAADRADELVGQLLLFSRREKTPKKVIDLNPAIEAVLVMLKRAIPGNIELTADLGPDLRRIAANRLNLQRMLLNLTVNARDALPDGGRITITTANVDIRPGESPSPDLRPGEYVRLTLEDNGTGMDEETRTRVFEPFFTTKGPGRGTGMGLAVVYGIVKDCRGGISVESRPGEGTRFEILLPAAENGVADSGFPKKI